MMDCDTTGIEPDIALVKYKQLAGGGMMKIVNQTVPLALETLGYGPEEITSIVNHINQEDTIEGAADLKPEHLPVFDCAFQPDARHAVYSLAGARDDDGRRPAVLVRGDFQDGEHAPRQQPGRHRRRVPGRVETGPQSAGRVPRRFEGVAAAIDQERRQDRKSGFRPAARTLARHAEIGDPQVQRRRPRGVHHRRPLSRRPPRRTVHHDGQGRGARSAG